MRRGYELATLFWGRAIRPFHLAVMISVLTIGYANTFSDGIVLTGATGNFVGAIALVAGISLFIGWWFRNEWFAEWGLLCAVGVFISRATFAVFIGEWDAAFLSLGWAIGAGGAYILERYDHVLSSEDG